MQIPLALWPSALSLHEICARLSPSTVQEHWHPRSEPGKSIKAALVCHLSLPTLKSTTLASVSLNLEFAVSWFGIGVRNCLSEDLLFTTYVSVFHLFSLEDKFVPCSLKNSRCLCVTCPYLHLGLNSPPKYSQQIEDSSTRALLLSQAFQKLHTFLHSMCTGAHGTVAQLWGTLEIQEHL